MFNSLSPSCRSTLCDADWHEAGQQNSRVPQIPGETDGSAGVGECEQMQCDPLRFGDLLKSDFCLTCSMCHHHLSWLCLLTVASFHFVNNLTPTHSTFLVSSTSCFLYCDGWDSHWANENQHHCVWPLFPIQAQWQALVYVSIYWHVCHCLWVLMPLGWFCD